MLVELVSILKWRGESRLPTELYLGSIECLATAFSSALVRIEKSGEYSITALRQQLKDIPRTSLLKLVTAPETFRKLCTHTPNREFIRFVDDSLAAETIRGGANVGVNHPVWTAHGDYCFDPSLDQPHFEAPTIFNIPIDFESPHSYGLDIPIEGSGSTVAHIARPILLEILREAVYGIAMTNTSAHEIMYLNTRVVVMKSNPAFEGFLSSSSPRFLGRTVLCNPENESREVLAEALIHESIHSLLCTAQLQYPFVLDHKGLSSASVHSPWTGKLLAMDAFVEACFVWFGLWAFWNLASDVREFDGDEVEKLLQRARQGFLGGALTNLIGEQRTMVTSDTLEAIALMQTTVRFEQL